MLVGVWAWGFFLAAAFGLVIFWVGFACRLLRLLHLLLFVVVTISVDSKTTNKSFSKFSHFLPHFSKFRGQKQVPTVKSK